MRWTQWGRLEEVYSPISAPCQGIFSSFNFFIQLPRRLHPETLDAQCPFDSLDACEEPWGSEAGSGILYFGFYCQQLAAAQHCYQRSRCCGSQHPDLYAGRQWFQHNPLPLNFDEHAAMPEYRLQAFLPPKVRLTAKDGNRSNGHKRYHSGKTE